MICLTFDTDYLSNRDMKLFLEKFPLPGKATFFAHKYFPALDSTVHEICPHPFITDLLTWEEEVKKISTQLKALPCGIRTHSCIFSHMIGISLKKMGFRYISQAQNMFQAGLKPIKHPWGIWEMPIYYMDNMDFAISQNWPAIKHEPFSSEVIKKALNDDSLYVFDLHPLHIALNTRTYDDYRAVKDKIMNKRVSPFKLNHDGRGVRSFFEELCAEIEKKGQRSYTCSEALEYFTGSCANKLEQDECYENTTGRKYSQ